MPIGRILDVVSRAMGRRLGPQRFGPRAMPADGPRPPAADLDIRAEELLNWGFICSGLPRGPKMGLDLGAGESPIIPAMLALGYDVTAADLCPAGPSDAGPRQAGRSQAGARPVDAGAGRAGASAYVAGIHSIPGDFLRLDPGPGAAATRKCFDVVVSCSVIERIGLAGRHGSVEDPDGDFKAMRAIAGILKRNGLFFLTVPVGRDTVVARGRRVYGRNRLPKLLAGFDLVDYRFLVKEPRGPWSASSADAALEFPADERRYALGQMILRDESDLGKPEI